MNQSTDNIEFSYTNWRASFLRVTLIGACIFGLAALIPGITTATAPIYAAIYIVLYLALLLVTIINFPHSIKAGMFIALVFLLGVSGLLETGIWGDSRLFMLGAIAMASLLFSWKAGWVVTGLTMLSYLITGWLVLSGSMTITNPDVPEGDFGIWASGSTAVLLLAVLIINGVRLTQDEFGKAQNRAETALDVLRNEKSTLEERVEKRTQDLASVNRVNEYRAQNVPGNRAGNTRHYIHPKPARPPPTDYPGNQSVFWFLSRWHFLDQRQQGIRRAKRRQQ